MTNNKPATKSMLPSHEKKFTIAVFKTFEDCTGLMGNPKIKILSSEQFSEIDGSQMVFGKSADHECRYRICYEELPDSNSQKPEEVQIGETYTHLENGANYRLAGIDSGNHAICIKLDGEGNKVIPIVNEIPTVDKFWQMFVRKAKVNETSNPVDLEKKEVNEVETALEELKNQLFYGVREGGYLNGTKVFALRDKAQDLVDALEAEKEVTQEDWEKYHANRKYKSEYQDNDMSKPEPQIDIKEERVEPVSIWKDVSELNNRNNFDNQDLILKMEDGKFILGQGYSKDIRPVGTNNFMYYQLKSCITLTDFINSIEQMQKDIEELKRK